MISIKIYAPPLIASFILLGQEERKKLREDGYNFAKDFTFERFKANWVTLINDLSSANEKHRVGN